MALDSALRSIPVDSFFFDAPAPTEIYTLSLHDALPICLGGDPVGQGLAAVARVETDVQPRPRRRRNDVDRKSTRLNSSHANISYAVVCLKKKTCERVTVHAPNNLRRLTREGRGDTRQLV